MTKNEESQKKLVEGITPCIISWSYAPPSIFIVSVVVTIAHCFLNLNLFTLFFYQLKYSFEILSIKRNLLNSTKKKKIIYIACRFAIFVPYFKAYQFLFLLLLTLPTAETVPCMISLSLLTFIKQLIVILRSSCLPKH